MSFNIGGAVNSAADWACNAPIIRGIVSNPVFTALLITALVVIVVMALYHDQLKKAGVKRKVRAVLYIFLLVTAVMFVHHYAVNSIARESAVQQGARDMFRSIQDSRDSGVSGTVPVLPMGYESEPAEAPLATGGGNTSSVSGGDCGCPDATVAGRRPDNIALDDDLVIEDVIVPTTVGPGSKYRK